MSRLAIVIVSYNTRSDLARCLRSLHASPPETSHEIVVVDNASHDGSPEMIDRDWPEVRLIVNRSNEGFARGSNLGIRATSAPLVLLLNSDTLAPPGAVDRLVAALDAHPEAAIAGPRLVDAQGRPELSFGRMIGPFNELRQKLIGRLYRRGWGPAVRLVERWTRTTQFPDWVSGACLLVRREDAERAGLLDERFFMYGEDVDFCAAVRQAGRRVLFTPNSEIVHARGRSAAADPAAVRRAYRASQLEFYAKHRPAWVGLLRLYLAVTGKRSTARQQGARAAGDDGSV